MSHRKTGRPSTSSKKSSRVISSSSHNSKSSLYDFDDEEIDAMQTELEDNNNPYEDEDYEMPGPCSSTLSISSTDHKYHTPKMKCKPKGSSGISGKKSADGTAIVKGNWTEYEDDKLRCLVDQYLVGASKRDSKGNINTRWSEIAKELPGRVGKQCRERWHNHLRPDINKGRWSFMEEVMIFVCWRNWGTQWARIARLLQGRSDNRVKNHWNCHMKRRLQRDMPYAEFMQEGYNRLNDPATVSKAEDENADMRFRSILSPKLEQYLRQNADKLDKLPYFQSSGNKERKSRSGPMTPSFSLVQDTLPIKSEPASPPQRAKKLGRKKSKRIILTPPPSQAASVPVTCFSYTTEYHQNLDADEENHLLYTAPADAFYGAVHYTSGVTNGSSNTNSSDEPFVVKLEFEMSQLGSPQHVLDSHLAYCEPHSYHSSPMYHMGDGGVDHQSGGVGGTCGQDDPLRHFQYHCDPLLSKAVTADFSANSPRYFSRTVTSTPLKQSTTSNFNVPLAAECGYNVMQSSPLISRAFGSSEDGFLSPIRRSYSQCSMNHPPDDPSLWTPVKSVLGQHDQIPWSPVKLGSIIKTPQPIRDALARSDASRKTISPEDLCSPGRLFSDASELIDGELNQSGGDLTHNGRRLQFTEFKNPIAVHNINLATPEMAMTKCRRRLMDQWTPSSSTSSTGTPSTSAGSFCSSGYGSFHMTPL